MKEKKKAKEVTDKPELPSTIGVLPYHPNLKLAFNRLASCLVFTYLETHHPAPQDTQGRISSLPVTVSVETACRDLQVSRRTLALALFPLCTLYREEARRWSAARGAREFINAAHKRASTHKVYSLVVDRTLDRAKTFILRRNLPLIAATLANCGISALACTIHTGPCTQQEPASAISSPTPVATPVITCPKSSGGPVTLNPMPGSLAEILLRASVLSQDRRKVRYSRLRKAVAEGIADKSEMSARQPKRKRKTDAVEPVLPDEVTNRLINLQKRGI